MNVNKTQNMNSWDQLRLKAGKIFLCQKKKNKQKTNRCAFT